MSRRLTLALGVLAVLLVCGALAIPGVVRGALQERAEANGLTVDVERVRLGVRGLWLLGVTVALDDSSALKARFDVVRVGVSLGGRMTSLEVAGGRVDLTGDLDSLRERLAKLRRPASADGSDSSAAGAAPVAVSGVEVVWHGDTTGEAHLWGVAVERVGKHTRAMFGRAEWSRREGRVVAEGVALELQANPARLVLTRADARSLTADLALDELPSDRGPSDQGQGSPPTGVSGAVSLAPVSKKSAAGASVPLAGFRFLDKDLGPRLNNAIQSMARTVGTHLDEASRIGLAGAHLRVHRGAETLNLGPLELSLARSSSRLTMTLSPTAVAEGSRLHVSVDAPLGEGETTLEIAGGPITLDSLGVHEGDMGLYRVSEALLDLETKATLAADGRSLGIFASGTIDNLNLQHPSLAPVPTDGIDLGWRVKARVLLDGSLIEVESSEVRISRTKAELAGSLRRSGSDASLNATLHVPVTSCQAILDSIPRALVPLLSGITLSGTFGLDTSIAFSSGKPNDIDFSWDLKNGCSTVSRPGTIDPSYFQAPFEYRVYRPDGSVMTRTTGPGTLSWVGLPDISSHLETAVLVCEDAHFWRHRGFDPKAIRSSILDNLRAGRFVRGASTLSMQLAKNLYLGREKTLSRKLQEFFLTMLLEQELRKDELLELYLNVVEFGPNVFGVKDAAQYYFGVHPRELTLGQALFFGSILPRPRGSYFGSDGKLRAGRAEYLRRLMQIAHKIERITDEELELGLKEEISFSGSRLPVGDELDPELGEDESEFGRAHEL